MQPEKRRVIVWVLTHINNQPLRVGQLFHDFVDTVLLVFCLCGLRNIAGVEQANIAFQNTIGFFSLRFIDVIFGGTLYRKGLFYSVTQDGDLHRPVLRRQQHFINAIVQLILHGRRNILQPFLDHLLNRPAVQLQHNISQRERTILFHHCNHDRFFLHRRQQHRRYVFAIDLFKNRAITADKGVQVVQLGHQRAKCQLVRELVLCGKHPFDIFRQQVVPACVQIFQIGRVVFDCVPNAEQAA